MILIDNNLSRKIAKELNVFFVGTQHVRHLLFDNASDETIWSYCKKNNMHILTKDNDFENLVALYGCPPKVIHLVCGNKSTQEIINLIQTKIQSIKDFILNDNENCLLILS
ncbi:MAG: hypothetical protein RJA07_857 [Bacteroidota bacterium]|jgi:predicted nuclease of predicted toxin-antitoxin system